ncbi:MAG: DJ-1/PfpI family protein [Bacillota bacterium]|nr:MAG: DJ-1/PfpI family protein [Bacillota bacterium]
MKGLLIVSHDMEDGEALTTRALLRRAGLEVDTLTFQDSKQIITAFGLKVEADYLYQEVSYDSYDFIVIPGGKYVAKIVNHDHHIKDAVKYFYDQKKLVAAICAGPRFLGQAGILDHKKFTCFTGSEIDMPKGTYLPHKKAVCDENIITARGAGAVYEFTYEIVNYLLGEEKAESLLKNILY